MDSIRDKYQKFGVKDYYSFHAGDYHNPHEPAIRKSILYIYQNWNLDFSRVLDLACGKGEVTKILQDLGVKDIEAMDPYLSKEYKKETGKDCFEVSFEDIMKGHYKGHSYSLVICSYALHLLDTNKLAPFLFRLGDITDDLIVISPHKRPHIKDTWGWRLEKEIIIDRVRTRYFSSTMQAYI
jgi:SAM-dependent methyltransferase